MLADDGDLGAFLAVARAGGFRQAARAAGVGASSLSAAVARLEARLGARLLNRTTRSVAPTEAGARLLRRLAPLVDEFEAALLEVRGTRDRPAGMLRLNVPVVAARLVLPRLLPGFLARYPDIRVEIVPDDSFVDVLASGCDAGIRYEERLGQDMVAVPIGPPFQRMATAASPAYLERRGRPAHPGDLLSHNCLLGRFPSGAITAPWEFERDGEILRVSPAGDLVVGVGAATDLIVEMAAAGTGIVHLFEDWLRPRLDDGSLVPLLEPWWQRFSGPFLYFPGRRHVPPALRAFVDHVAEASGRPGRVRTGAERLTP